MKRTPFVSFHVFYTLLAFLVNSIGPISFSQAQEITLPVPGVMVQLSPEFNPPLLKGVTVHPDNPFKFDFILDLGDDRLSPSGGDEYNRHPERSEGSRQERLKQESAKLVKYFLAAITTPEKDLWVNLSPYEKNRIIPNSFGQTSMGRDLLAEDYILKQVTASLMYPEGEIGKRFWQRVYQEAKKKFGTTSIPVNTFNKVWIVPDHAKVYEHGNTAFVVKATLKVMLEEDYLALSKNNPDLSLPLAGRFGEGGKDINALGSSIVRQIVIPELTKEVNEGKNFAPLRQVYYSLILATWFKKRMKDSVLGRKYINQNKVSYLSSQSQIGMASPNAFIGDPDTIYQRYLRAFKKGVYNYIKETDTPSGVPIPRKYFSGGFVGDFAMNSFEIVPIISRNEIPDSARVTGVEVNLADRDFATLAGGDLDIATGRLPEDLHFGAPQQVAAGSKEYEYYLGSHPGDGLANSVWTSLFKDVVDKDRNLYVFKTENNEGEEKFFHVIIDINNFFDYSKEQLQQAAEVIKYGNNSSKYSKEQYGRTAGIIAKALDRKSLNKYSKEQLKEAAVVIAYLIDVNNYSNEQLAQAAHLIAQARINAENFISWRNKMPFRNSGIITGVRVLNDRSSVEPSNALLGFSVGRSLFKALIKADNQERLRLQRAIAGNFVRELTHLERGDIIGGRNLEGETAAAVAQYVFSIDSPHQVLKYAYLKKYLLLPFLNRRTKRSNRLEDREYLRASELVKPMKDEGDKKVFRMKGPDKNIFYIKVNGDKELRREYFNYRIARLMGVNVPRVGFITKGVLRSIPGFGSLNNESAIVIQSIDDMQWEDLNQNHGTSLDEILLLGHLMWDFDFFISGRKNIGVKMMAGLKRYFRYDLESFDSFGYFKDRATEIEAHKEVILNIWLDKLEDIKPEHFNSALSKLENIDPRDIDSAAEILASEDRAKVPLLMQMIKNLRGDLVEAIKLALREKLPEKERGQLRAILVQMESELQYRAVINSEFIRQNREFRKVVINMNLKHAEALFPGIMKAYPKKSEQQVTAKKLFENPDILQAIWGNLMTSSSTAMQLFEADGAVDFNELRNLNVDFDKMVALHYLQTHQADLAMSAPNAEQISRQERLKKFEDFLMLDGQLKDLMHQPLVTDRGEYDTNISLYRDEIRHRLLRMQNVLSLMAEDLAAQNKVSSGVIDKINERARFLAAQYIQSYNYNVVKQWYGQLVNGITTVFLDDVNSKIVAFATGRRFDENFIKVADNVTSFNEILNLMHRYALVNVEILGGLVIWKKSGRADNDGQILAVGEKTPVAERIFNELQRVFTILMDPASSDHAKYSKLWPGDLPLSVHIFSLPNITYLMVRDYGHALFIEVKGKEGDQLVVTYRIPKAFSKDAVSHIPDVAYSEATGTASGQLNLVDSKDIGPVLADFIRKVPTDTSKWTPGNDSAMKVNKQALGGIDLTANRMKLEVDSDKGQVSQPLDLKALENIEIHGLYIKDIEIKPLKDLPQLLGVSAS